MADDDGNGPDSSRLDRRFLLIGLPAVVVILLVMAFVTISFNRGLAPGEEKNAFGATAMSAGIQTTATINAVDPLKAEMTIRLAMQPIGSLADPSGLLTKPVTLYYDSVDGTKQIDFKAGKPLGATDLTVPLLDGTISSYPWDKYTGDIQLTFVTVGGLEAEPAAAAGGTSTTSTPTTTAPTTEPTPTTEPAPTSVAPGSTVAPGTTVAESPTTEAHASPLRGIRDATTEAEPTPATAGTAATKAAKPDTNVPATMAVFENVPAYNMIDVTGSADADGVLSAHFDISRNSSTLFFSGVVTLVMWALALGVGFIALSVVLRRRKFELAQITMMAAILFALPAALRGSQPGIPPPGVLCDFYGFFFCDVIVAMSLIVVITVYLKRRAV